MPRQLNNSFSSFHLTEKEMESASQLTELTIKMIQNLKSQIAEELINLDFTPNDVLSYTQQDAYKKGQLAAFSYLLQLAADSKQFHTIED